MAFEILPPGTRVRIHDYRYNCDVDTKIISLAADLNGVNYRTPGHGFTDEDVGKSVTVIEEENNVKSEEELRNG